MQLREWQQRFQDAVLGAGCDDLPLRSGGLPRELGIGIYANAYRARLSGALRDNYTALHRLLGDDAFAALAGDFIDAQPPSTVSIRWFGAALPDYLAATDPYAAHPAIGELARFEWALRNTVDAADARRIGFDDLAALSPDQWEALRCSVHPSLTLLHFDWNAPQVWRALDAGEIPPAPVRLHSRWLVYRDTDLAAQWRSADALEAAALECWRRGEAFGALCALLEQHVADAESAAATAAAFMRGWVEQGLLVRAATNDIPE